MDESRSISMLTGPFLHPPGRLESHLRRWLIFGLSILCSTIFSTKCCRWKYQGLVDTIISSYHGFRLLVLSLTFPHAMPPVTVGVEESYGEAYHGTLLRTNCWLRHCYSTITLSHKSNR